MSCGTFRPCFSASQCSDGEQSSANCWIVIIVQASLSLILILTAAMRKKLKSRRELKKEGPESQSKRNLSDLLPMMRQSSTVQMVKLEMSAEEIGDTEDFAKAAMNEGDKSPNSVATDKFEVNPVYDLDGAAEEDKPTEPKITTGTLYDLHSGQTSERNAYHPYNMSTSEKDGNAPSSASSYQSSALLSMVVDGEGGEGEDLSIEGSSLSHEKKVEASPDDVVPEEVAPTILRRSLPVNMRENVDQVPAPATLRWSAPKIIKESVDQEKAPTPLRWSSPETMNEKKNVNEKVAPTTLRRSLPVNMRENFAASSTKQFSENFLGGIEDESESAGRLRKSNNKTPISTMNSPLCKTFRSEKNFIMSNVHPDLIIPSSHDPEYEPIPEWSVGLVLHTAGKAFLQWENNQNMVMNNLGLAFFASSFASLLAMVFRYEEDMAECNPEHHIIGTKQWLGGNTRALSSTIDAFKFLPIFLLIAYIGFLVDRWRNFMVSCHTIQGRIKDLGMLAGSIPSVPVSIEERKHLYKIYRYLNSVHILLYRNFISIFKNGDDGIGRMVEMGLITEDEAVIIDSFGNKAREGLLTMLLVEMKKLVNRSEDEVDATSNSIVLKTKACELRGEMSKLHDLFVRGKFFNMLTCYRNRVIC